MLLAGKARPLDATASDLRPSQPLDSTDQWRRAVGQRRADTLAMALSTPSGGRSNQRDSQGCRLDFDLRLAIGLLAADCHGQQQSAP